MYKLKLIPKKGSTLHDYPYSSPGRKCPHFWIINVTPPGPSHCLHQCIYCYARCAVYSDYSQETLVYDNLPELVERDLKRISLCPPISISNVSDPCQPIPRLRAMVKELVKLLMFYGVSFAITTKGDPSFLLDLPGFADYKQKFIAMTIEGNAHVLSLLSPLAPPFAKRMETVHHLSGLGINTVIRFDPLFIHLFQALYGEAWFKEIERVIHTFASTGAKHIVCSTGRLSKKAVRRTGKIILNYSFEEGKKLVRPELVEGSFDEGPIMVRQAHREQPPLCHSRESENLERIIPPTPYSSPYMVDSIWERVRKVIQRYSPKAASRFEQEYIFERGGTSQGYVLSRDKRLCFHWKMRTLVESYGITYATCQELGAEEADSPGLSHCQRFALPFSRKQSTGRFEPVQGCTANCHVSCRGLKSPPCGQPELICPRPFKIGYLRDERG